MAVKAQATNINVINAIRNSVGMSFQDRIPPANAANIQTIYADLLNYIPAREMFARALIEMITVQQIETIYFENPLGILKKEPMRYGNTEQEIFVNMAKGYTFDSFAGAGELYQYYDSEIMSAYHKMSPALQYAVTITFDNLRTAFSSEYGIRDLITAKAQSLVTGANWDEYLQMKMIGEAAYANGQIYAVKATEPTNEATSKEFTVLMKTWIEKIKFPSRDYNIAGAVSSALLDGIFYLTTPEYDSRLTTEVLAYAFNNNFAMINAHKIIVDKFDNPDLMALVFDIRWFKVREQFRTMSDAKNGAALSWNYFYTIKEMFSFSPFFPCIAITKNDVGVTSITAVADPASIKRGEETKIVVTGTGSGYVPNLYDFEVSGQTSKFTNMIPGSNILATGNDETAGTVTVKVTSRVDPTVTTTVDVVVS